MLGRINPAVGYEVVVDYGVEEEGVYAVVEVTVHVIIGPVDVNRGFLHITLEVIGRRASYHRVRYSR